jgi:ALG3 protein
MLIKRQWTLGGVAYALALGIKMNALLYLPGIVVVVVMTASLERMFRLTVTIAQFQVPSSLLLWADWGSFCWRTRFFGSCKVMCPRRLISRGLFSGSGRLIGGFWGRICFLRNSLRGRCWWAMHSLYSSSRSPDSSSISSPKKLL